MFHQTIYCKHKGEKVYLNNMKLESFYNTRDLASATYIAYSGVKFSKPYDKTTRSWYFEDPEKCEKLDLELRNGESFVEVIKYESTRRLLLGMVKQDV